MRHVVSISGKRRSGKDVTASHLDEFERFKFATEIYDEVYRLGFTPRQMDEHKEVLRPIMMAIGDARRHFDADHYPRATMRKIEMADPELAVITDLRFRNEAEFLRRWARENGVGMTLVRIERPGFPRRDPADRHQSETDLDHWTDWDLIVNAEEGRIDQLQLAAELIRKMVN